MASLKPLLVQIEQLLAKYRAQEAELAENRRQLMALTDRLPLNERDRALQSINAIESASNAAFLRTLKSCTEMFGGSAQAKKRVRVFLAKKLKNREGTDTVESLERELNDLFRSLCYS
jgi:hypothetical protein